MINNKIKILITAPCNENVRDNLSKRFGDRCEFTYSTAESAQDILMSADAVIGEIPLEWIIRSKSLKWVQLTWAGADKYTKSGIFPNDIILTNASGAFGVIISEYVIAGILCLYRKFPQYIKNQSKALWKDMGSFQSLYGKTALILGTGDIGKNTALRLKAFGAKNIGIRRNITCDVPYFDEIHSSDSLCDLLPIADIVISCLPLNKNTDGLMSESKLQLMKNSSVFVNVGRGRTVDTNALTKMLLENKIMGAILDVTDPEPLPVSSPLWQMDNVIITPHIAGPSFGHNKATEDKIWKICMENIDRFLSKNKLINIVNISE